MCSAPMEYRVPADVTVVQKMVPRKDVTRVVVHNWVTAIEADAFRDWTSLEAVVFEDRGRLERIGDHAFAGTALREVVAPGSLKTIGAGAFADCRNLKQVRLNEGLESLGGEGDGVFQGSGVEEIYLPSTLREMSRATFSKCKSLRRARVVDGCRADIKHCVQSVVTVEIVAHEVSTSNENEETTEKAAQIAAG